MRILTETKLRAMTLAEGTTEYQVTSDVFVTPLAKEYLRDRHINLVIVDKKQSTMARTPLPDCGDKTYIDASTGEGYRKKPEHMTHLVGNKLVPKDHPRIAFRGKLDSLEADIILLQSDLHERGYNDIVKDLDNILNLVRQILSAEVNDKPLEPVILLGMDASALQKNSHNMKEYIGFDHPVPDYHMGGIAARLNVLRTRIRETELAAVNTFRTDKGYEREDILLMLNRLSSAVYIMFCHVLSGYYKGGIRR
jgi:ethanolamine utilization cobalamin adenosyltransferase